MGACVALIYPKYWTHPYPPNKDPLPDYRISDPKLLGARCWILRSLPTRTPIDYRDRALKAYTRVYPKSRMRTLIDYRRRPSVQAYPWRFLAPDTAFLWLHYRNEFFNRVLAKNRLGLALSCPKVGARRNSFEVGARPDSSKVWARPHSSKVWASPNSSKVGARPNSSKVGARPNSSMVWARPNTSMVWARPNSSMVWACPNSSKVWASPNSSKFGARPNSSKRKHKVTCLELRPVDNQTMLRADQCHVLLKVSNAKSFKIREEQDDLIPRAAILLLA
ncbi:hypothetical protein AgCh_012001 [Apium graveolens]